ncbi:DUF134 domain-containing protein [Crassaminicella thermophila]|uniref:UPF0251 protein FQB35_03585 n=1 Tax=Crassaminicella thermophila TaxID=2599308 RepID=A0A5C0SEY8_CRATE|nr:DUF134 domain-containing protein [Crassaminicella thermophila]QEK11529.1 DUF134 domain-containing protein [Crassaminicella thermophila]
MSRPRKWRRICNMPKIDVFGPCIRDININETIQMTLEEFETIRLIDYEGLSQEECGQIMGVARSTIQRIYNDARKKIADSIINGKYLKIKGGNYKLCDEIEGMNICKGCVRKRHRGGRNI